MINLTHNTTHKNIHHTIAQPRVHTKRYYTYILVYFTFMLWGVSFVSYRIRIIYELLDDLFCMFLLVPKNIQKSHKTLHITVRKFWSPGLFRGFAVIKFSHTRTEPSWVNPYCCSELKFLSKSSHSAPNPTRRKGITKGKKDKNPWEIFLKNPPEKERYSRSGGLFPGVN